MAYSFVQSQLVKDGEEFLLKKAPLKNHRVLDPIKLSPVVVSATIRKEAPTESVPMGATLLKALTNSFPQVGQNRTTEALKVVFDPTQGDEGVESPSSNDSLKVSLSPPVGGRLRSFRNWRTNKCSNVLNIIIDGYILPFISKPKLATVPLIYSGYKVLQKKHALAACIQSLLSKNAIERVEM